MAMDLARGRWRSVIAGLLVGAVLPLGAAAWLFGIHSPPTSEEAAAAGPFVDSVSCSDIYLGLPAGGAGNPPDVGQQRIGKTLSRQNTVGGNLDNLVVVTYLGYDDPLDADVLPEEPPDEKTCLDKVTDGGSAPEANVLEAKTSPQANQYRPTTAVAPNGTLRFEGGSVRYEACVFSPSLGQWVRSDVNLVITDKTHPATNYGVGMLTLGTTSPSDAATVIGDPGRSSADPTGCKPSGTYDSTNNEDGGAGADCGDTLDNGGDVVADNNDPDCYDSGTSEPYPFTIEQRTRDITTDNSALNPGKALDADGPNPGNPVTIPQDPDSNDGLADDWDGDGCTDWDELASPAKSAADPFNGEDCDDDYGGIFDVLATVQPAGKTANGSPSPGIYIHCIARVDQAGSNLDTRLACYGDLPLTVNATVGYLAHFDGLAGAPPPPPYAPALAEGQGQVSGGLLTGDGCFVFEGVGVYLQLEVKGRTLLGTADPYLQQTPTDCEAGTPSGGGGEIPVVMAEQRDDIDTDRDGCTDMQELADDQAPGGVDPFNPNDCDSNLYGIFYTLVRIAEQGVCQNHQPSPACDGIEDGELFPGSYLHCIADSEPNGGPGTVRTASYCYSDIPGVDVNPHVAGASGDGRTGPSPPPPYGEVHNAHAVFTGTITGTTVNQEGCFPNVHGALGPNIYTRTSVSTITGQGTADVWTGRPDCNNPDPNPPNGGDDVLVYGVEQGQGVDTDGDNCTDKEELGQTGALGGLRDPFNWGDFMSVYTGPIASLQKDQVVSVADISAVVARFGANDSGGTTKINRNTDPKSRPAGTTYHPSYDRGGPIPNGGVPGSVSRQTPANTGSGAGSVTVADISAVVAQFGASCAGPP
jgi:hypothetical protein